MRKILMVGGGTAYRIANVRLKRELDYFGVHTKTIRKKDNEGNIRGEYVYYYQKIPRTETEKQELVNQGKNPYQTNVMYKDKFIGKYPPKGYGLTILQQWEEQGLLKLQDKDLLVDESLAERLFKDFPQEFNQKEVTCYALEKGEI